MSRKKSAIESRAGRAVYAAKIKERRVALGMRQEDLASAAGVSRTTLIDIEAGKLVPQTGTLLRLLNAVGIDVDPDVDFAPETELWLGVLGGMLDALPSERRNRAGQAAVNAVTSELVRPAASVGDATDDDYDFEANPPKQGDLRLAAKRGAMKKDTTE